jgi:hypothetical protein
LVPLFVVALYLSFSRGSWVALFFGLAATVALDPRRLTILWSASSRSPGVGPRRLVASRQDALTTDKVPGRRRWRTTGHRLAAALAVLDRRVGGAWVAAHLVAARVRSGADPPWRRDRSRGAAIGAVVVHPRRLGGPSRVRPTSESASRRHR